MAGPVFDGSGRAFGVFTSKEAAEEFVAGNPFITGGVMAHGFGRRLDGSPGLAGTCPESPLRDPRAGSALASRDRCVAPGGTRARVAPVPQHQSRAPSTSSMAAGNYIGAAVGVGAAGGGGGVPGGQAGIGCGSVVGMGAG